MDKKKDMIKAIKMTSVTIGIGDAGREEYYDKPGVVIESGDKAFKVLVDSIYGPEELYFKDKGKAEEFLGRKIPTKDMNKRLRL